MGGGYYDRQMVYPTTVKAASKPINEVVGQVSKLYPGLDPKNYVKPNYYITCQNQNPIIFTLDVTGSMGQWPKFIYDKLPMFYGQIKMKNYLKDPAISFCAVGDVYSDKAPLQVSEFGQGKEIDEMIAKLWLEGGGGPDIRQSYEFSAYFYNHYVTTKTKGMKFFFITGDESFYQTVKKIDYQKFLGVKLISEVHPFEEFKVLQRNYNLFLIKKQYKDPKKEPLIYSQWVEAIGEDRILKIKNSKACVDTILGAIALTSGRTLEQYEEDMREKLQDKERIDEVSGALKKYWYGLKTGSTVPQGQDAVLLYKPLPPIPEPTPQQYRSTLQQMLKSCTIPSSCICPLTNSIYVQPVRTCDGLAYQKQAIEQWFKTNDTSPVTGKKLDTKAFFSGTLLKKQIRRLYEEYVRRQQGK